MIQSPPRAPSLCLVVGLQKWSSASAGLRGEQQCGQRSRSPEVLRPRLEQSGQTSEGSEFEETGRGNVARGRRQGESKDPEVLRSRYMEWPPSTGHRAKAHVPRRVRSDFSVPDTCHSQSQALELQSRRI